MSVFIILCTDILHFVMLCNVLATRRATNVLICFTNNISHAIVALEKPIWCNASIETSLLIW